MENKKGPALSHVEGFTIIELVISIFIMSIAVVGIFNAFSVMVVLTNNDSDRFTGAYLAQEGIEVVRNIRDTNWLNISNGATSDTWLDGLVKTTPTGIDCSSSGCELDYTTTGTALAPVAPFNGTYLRIDPNNDFYNYKSGDATKFTRKIVISCIDATGAVDADCNSADYIINVVSTVYWKEKPNMLSSATQGSISVQEYFYNWDNKTSQ